MKEKEKEKAENRTCFSIGSELVWVRVDVIPKFVFTVTNPIHKYEIAISSSIPHYSLFSVETPPKA